MLDQKVIEASLSDVSEIVGICNSRLLAKQRDEERRDAGKKGFLIQELTDKVVQEMILDKENFLVLAAKSGDEVLGYLIACDMKKTDNLFQKEVLELQRAQSLGAKTFYYRQIAKKIGTKNVGEKLVLAMINELKTRSYSSVICKIVHQPFCNLASINFHKKLGFEELISMSDNELTVGIYLKNL